MTGSSGVSSTPQPVDSITSALEYWIARFRGRRQTDILRRSATVGTQAAGTGNAVTDLIFSIANREVTFFSGTALISFL